jgi:hypothetical protein
MMRRVRSLMMPALMAAGLAGSANEALAQGCYSSTVFASPIETAFSVPSSYVTTSYSSPSILSTSFYSPTSYVVPTTAYLPTSAVYYPTRYSRPYRYRYRASRAYIPTSYWDTPVVATSMSVYSPAPLISTSRVVYDSLMPTSYIVSRPTTYVVPTSTTMIASSSSACCDSAETVVTRPAAPVNAAPSSRPQIQSTPSNVVPQREEQAPSANLESNPTTESTYTGPAPKRPITSTQAPAAPAEPTQAPAAKVEQTPPPVPKVEAPAATDPAAPTSPALDAFPPISPRTSLDAPTTRRDSMRPSLSNQLASSMAILNGKVLARGSNRAEEGVKVVLQDQMDRFADRVAMTDAYGRFAVSLPTGDWALKVTMPSGNVMAVDTGPLTSSGGEVSDGSGVAVPLVTIRR